MGGTVWDWLVFLVINGIFAKENVSDAVKHVQSNMSGLIANVPVAENKNMNGIDANAAVAVISALLITTFNPYPADARKYVHFVVK